MRWNELETERCPVARTMSVVGDRWTMLILRDAFRGAKKFDEFHDRLQCSRAVVAERLMFLVERGVLTREPYQSNPPRHDYLLTEMGRALGPILMTMGQWAEAWMPHPTGARIERVHKTCGHAFQARVHCSECGEPVGPGEVHYPSPALKQAG